MPDTRGAVVTPIVQSKGFLSAARSVIVGADNTAWFTPGQPVPPQAPTGTDPRRWDYQTGANINYVPRAEEVVSFEALRNLADLHDLLRGVMETAKDQVTSIPWEIRVKQKPGESNATYKARALDDPRIRPATEMFECPDGDHLWDSWSRMFWEEQFVLDALALYPRRSKVDRKRVLIDVMSGDTIKRLIDTEGRTPEPPQPAYQQIIKGVPGHSFTSDQLIYRCRNPRANRMYGLGPVEQCVITINLAIRRQLYKLNYYTVGNMPEAIAQVPETWSPDRIKQFQEMFNAMLAGQLDQRRQITFVPGFGGKDSLVFPKQDAIKDEMDEWLARIFCYFFSVSPQPFIREGMSRYGVQQQAQMAKAEGLLPRLMWQSKVLTDILARVGWDDLEFVFQQDVESDYLKRAQIQEIEARSGIRRIDEIREENGDEPLGVGAGIITGQGFVAFPGEPGSTDGPEVYGAGGMGASGEGEGILADGTPADTGPGATGGRVAESGGVAQRGGALSTDTVKFAKRLKFAGGGPNAFGSVRQQGRTADLVTLLDAFLSAARTETVAKLPSAYESHAPPETRRLVGKVLRGEPLLEPAHTNGGNGDGHGHGHGPEPWQGQVELVRAVGDAIRRDEPPPMPAGPSLADIQAIVDSAVQRVLARPNKVVVKVKRRPKKKVPRVDPEDPPPGPDDGDQV